MLRSCSRKRPATFCFRGKRMLHCSVFAEKFDTKVIVWRISHDKISCFTKEIVSLFCEKYLSQLLSSPDYHSKGGEFVPAQLTKKKIKLVCCKEAHPQQAAPPTTLARKPSEGVLPVCLPCGVFFPDPNSCLPDSIFPSNHVWKWFLEMWGSGRMAAVRSSIVFRQLLQGIVVLWENWYGV